MDNIIHLKDVVQEDFLNYKKPSMFLITAHCNWKCCIEANIPITSCQNQSLVIMETRKFYVSEIIDTYLKNDITKAIVFGGLEPFEQISAIDDFIYQFRKVSEDDIVIYTGYNKNELTREIDYYKRYKNIIIKFGRYIPNQKPHFDEILGVELCSDNQYAERIS